MNHLLALLFALSWVLFFLPERFVMIGAQKLPGFAIAVMNAKADAIEREAIEMETLLDKINEKIQPKG